MEIKSIYFSGRNFGYFAIIYMLFFGWSFAQETFAEKIGIKGFKRLYKLNDSVYRSEQPSTKGFQQLEEIGLKTIINFRRNKKDDRKARKTQLVLEHFPLKTKELTEEQILTALKLVQSAEKPVLLHCWHGSDRTGAISAAYRIVFEDWDKEKAIEELRKKEFGYHENWYPNVKDLLRDLNVDALRKELKLTR
ncbi:MAG: dual specificity protein phosphatase family protein [Bacteroidota bacterium]